MCVQKRMQSTGRNCKQQLLSCTIVSHFLHFSVLGCVTHTAVAQLSRTNIVSSITVNMKDTQRAVHAGAWAGAGDSSSGAWSTFNEHLLSSVALCSVVTRPEPSFKCALSFRNCMDGVRAFCCSATPTGSWWLFSSSCAVVGAASICTSLPLSLFS